MKKAILFILFLIASIPLMAQANNLVEVRGVDMQWVQYRSDGKDVWGVKFTNRNTFSVTVDAELIRNAYVDRGYTVPEQIYNTRSIFLNAGENFTWRLDFNNYSESSGAYNSIIASCHVRFKAYKN